MKLPHEITGSWLNRTSKGFQCPNAHRFLTKAELRLIPEADFGEFLAVTDAKGDTTLHLIANNREAFAYVAERRIKFLTPKALSRTNRQKLTPLWNAMWGPDGLVPWKEFQKQAKSWVTHLSALKILRREYRQGLTNDGIDPKTDENLRELSKLLERVTKWKHLKDRAFSPTSSSHP